MEANMCVRLRQLYSIILIGASLLALPVCAGAADKKNSTGPAVSGGDGGNTLQRRIDFGNSYILGQSIKSGAVYLLHRKKSEIKSMLHYRENYRDEILESFSVDADSELGQNIGPEMATETLSLTPKKHSPTKKTVLK